MSHAHLKLLSSIFLSSDNIEKSLGLRCVVDADAIIASLFSCLIAVANDRK